MTTRQPRSVHLIKLDDIIADDGGPRPVDDAAVARLARSMAEIGLQTPISVVFEDFAEDNKGRNNRTLYRAVSGRHRIAAARSLGWAEIEAFRFDYDPVVDDSPEDADPNILAEMWAIAENLHRAELTALERDTQIARWIELEKCWRAERERVSPQVVAKPDGGRPVGGTRAAARELGINREDARRAEQVASLSDEARETAREVGLDDNRSALLAAARSDDSVTYLRAEHARREAARQRKEVEKLNSDTDRVIALSATDEFATWLMERTDLHELPTIITWLECVKPRDLIAALRRSAA